MSDKKNPNNPFPYFVGVDSLHKIANKHSRVCVMNILGSESSKVTPVSHAYSGGNIVAGVQYGRTGSLETPLGDIPVYGSVREVLKAGHHFDTGVIYLPPSAVSHAVSEMCAQNDELEKIVILTEKVSVKDGRIIRFGCQKRGVDCFGANSLGIANTWDEVRVGGALGGDNPANSLKKGSIAIYSNSGNFCTTISEYIKTAGFGTSTILSSGKDLYIHFALAEFLYCAENDPRTKAVVVYIEPGGYYERLALDWIREGRFQFTKPIIALVTGRWKANLTRSCGHAGAMSGSGDGAIDKEKWFDEYFGVDVFDPENPQVSSRGVRVKSIQYVPRGLAAVMKKIGAEPDFEAVGDLRLKPWFVSQQIDRLPAPMNIKAVEAVAPYNEQIEAANRMVGSQLVRENMRNASGASMMNPKTQVTEVHGKDLLGLVEKQFGATTIFALTKELPDDDQMKVLTPVLNYFVSRGTRWSATAAEGRKNGASPNGYLAAGILLQGNNPFLASLQRATSALIDLFYVDIRENPGVKEDIIKKKLDKHTDFTADSSNEADGGMAEYFLNLVRSHKQETIFTRFAEEYIDKHKDAGTLVLVLASILLGVSWRMLTKRRITRQTAEELGIYLALNGVLVGTAAVDMEKNDFWKRLRDLKSGDPAILETDFASTCFQVLFNRVPNDRELFSLNALLNLTISNGPGTLSAKGAKESVSAKNHISTAYAGFMTNTGYAHGGNGYEAIGYLIEEFGDYDPFKADKGALPARLAELAKKSAAKYAEYKIKEKNRGNMNYRKIPCTNHPVFKGKPVNIDPREEFIAGLFEKKNIANPFQGYYHHLVKELFNAGVTKNVFCVNIDAVLATVSLELFWKDMKAGKIEEKEMQDIVFTIFLVARMVGTSAEVADHRARGTDMDCRTPASQLTFIK